MLASGLANTRLNGASFVVVVGNLAINRSNGASAGLVLESAGVDEAFCFDLSAIGAAAFFGTFDCAEEFLRLLLLLVDFVVRLFDFLAVCLVLAMAQSCEVRLKESKTDRIASLVEHHHIVTCPMKV